MERCDAFVKNLELSIGKEAVDSNIWKAQMMAVCYLWTPEYGLHYKRMNYPYGDDKSYLNTRYWQILRAYFIQRRGNKCEREQCGKEGVYRLDPLELHHNAYRFVGEEHLHEDTLEVLCDECHKYTHVGKTNTSFW